MRKHESTHTTEKPFKCTNCNQYFAEEFELKQHEGTHINTKTKGTIKIGSLNIRNGLYTKESLLHSFMIEHDLKIFSLCETEVENYDTKKPFLLEGFKTFHSTERACQKYKRIIMLVAEEIECEQRLDLQSNDVANIWVEIKIAKCPEYNY